MIATALGFALAAALAAAPVAPAPAPAPAAGDEIVVTARRGKCELRMARHVMTSQQVNAYAREWSLGRPVRVVEPRGADQKCLTRIMFKLARKGVRIAEFVDRSEDR